MQPNLINPSYPLWLQWRAWYRRRRPGRTWLNFGSIGRISANSQGCCVPVTINVAQPGSNEVATFVIECSRRILAELGLLHAVNPQGAPYRRVIVEIRRGEVIRWAYLPDKSRRRHRRS